MSLRFPFLLLATLLVAGALTSLAPGAPAASEVWSARILDLSASYGPEAWKYDPGYEGQASPTVVAAHLQNQTTSYNGALGLRVTLKVQLYKVDDASAQPTRDHNLSAYIDTPRGPLYAFVKRDATTSTFYLDFDMDGANNAAPNGKTPPPATAGLQTVVVKIFRRVNDVPSSEPAGDVQFQFMYDVPYGTVTDPAMAGLISQQPVPDHIFRLFNDVGWDRSVQAFLRPVDPTHTLDLAYAFDPAAAGQTVELYGYVAERGQPTPAGPAPTPGATLPFVPGVSDNQTFQSLVHNTDRLVTVYKKLLASQKVGDDGNVLFALKAGDLVQIRTTNPEGLFVVAPLLADNFDASACPGDCRGGSQFRIGATEFVVPVSNRRVGIDGYELEDPALTGNQAPGPVRDIALAANALQVRVRDFAGYSAQDPRTGDVYALVPDGRSPTALSGGGLSPSQRETPSPNEPQTLMAGDLPVKPIQAQHVSYYRVMALLYRPDDSFYGATFADRGYTVQLSAPVATVPPGEGGVWLNLTSRTTNYDATAEEQTLDLRVVYELRSPDLNVNASQSVLLREGRTTSEFIPLTSSQAGRFLVTVNSTSGDTLPRPYEVSAEFREPPAKKGLVDRIPGPELPLLLCALAALAILRRR